MTNCFVFTGWNRILSLQQAAQIQIDLVLFDLSQQENSITGTKIFANIFQYMHSDLLLQFVAVQKEQLVARMCCSNMSSTVLLSILDLTQNQSKISEQTWTGLDWINGCHSAPQYLSFTWFVQLQTNKFQGLFRDFSRTNYSFQGLRFIYKSAFFDHPIG